MPNVLNPEPLNAFIRRAAGKIADEQVAARFQRLAFKHLCDDPRNFRAAEAADVRSAPVWARAAFTRGESVDVFTLNRSTSARLHALARRLADACTLASSVAAAAPAEKVAIAAAQEFIDKLDRANFDVVARKALHFSRLRASLQEAHDTAACCAPQIIPSTHGRVWIRITSVAALRAVGREFHNCLARTTRASGYGGALHEGSAQFWMLRDKNGDGLIVVMATAPVATQFTEVRGPRNTRIDADHADLVRLASALGMAPREPPPPTQPSPAMALSAAAILFGEPQRALITRLMAMQEVLRPLPRRAARP